jgi:hypothetical protein
VDGAFPAVLFRKIEHDMPTLLFDELDTTFKGDKETANAIRQVLNAGAKYNGTIARVVGKNHTPKDFRVFCPKVLAGIGNLPPTVSGRSLPITLGRKLPTEKVDYLEHEDFEIKAKAGELCRRLADWIEKHTAGFKQSPDFPNILTDRQKDGARILLAIADAAGGDWPSQARGALCDVYSRRPELSCEPSDFAQPSRLVVFAPAARPSAELGNWSQPPYVLVCNVDMAPMGRGWHWWAASEIRGNSGLR